MSFQIRDIFLPFLLLLMFSTLCANIVYTSTLPICVFNVTPYHIANGIVSLLQPITLQMELDRIPSTKNSIINMDVQSQSLICQRQQKHWIDLPKDGIVCVKLLIMKLINYYWDFVCSAIIHPHCIYSKKCYRESTISCFNSLSNTRYICFLCKVEELLPNLSPSYYSASHS